MQAFVAQALEALDGVARGQELEHFVEQARRRHVLEQAGEFADRSARGRFDGEVEFRRQAHGAQHAHRVFLVALGRVAYQAYLSIAEYIGEAVPYPPAIAVDAPETLVGSMNETELKVIDFIQRLRYFDPDTKRPHNIEKVPELPSAMPFTSPLDALREGRVAIRVDLLV